MTVTITAGRRAVPISRPDKRLIPPDVTKADLARYYAAVAEVMLPHLARRPLNFERFPDGIEGHRFFQQHASGHFPDWIPRVEVRKSGGTVQHVVANEQATLVYLANQACITLHCWLSRTDRLMRPDKLVVDLDPSDQGPAEIRRAARIIVALVREVGLTPWAMTSGSRGYHIVVSLARRADYEPVREFAVDLARLACAREPRLFTLEQRKANRDGRILVDIMRNGYARTSVAPYSVRARPEGPVATPLHIEELSDRRTRADRWTLRSVPARLDREGDPWRTFHASAQTLTAARARLTEALAEI